MNQELLQEMIDHWEERSMTVVRTIDSDEDCVERILSRGSLYWMFRYFTLGSNTPGIADRVCCSVDLECVDAERVIQHLAERL